MKATIRDVAKLAGVSTSTVSFVLNDKPFPISKQTKDTVLQAAKELHYRPNQLAVGLVRNRTNTLGLIVPDNSNPFFAVLSNQIEKLANKNGYAVILGNTNNSAKAMRDYLRIFTDRSVDGIILAQADSSNPEENRKLMSLLNELKVPIISVDRIYKESNINYVAVDQCKAGYLATSHLLYLGHRRIGCASGSLDLSNCHDRLSGYKKALEEYGIPFEKNLVYEEALDLECGIHALPVLLGQNVSAIFAFNDLIAYGIYKEVRNYNLSLPDDLSVVGLDDIFLSEIIQPPLTTVAQPVSEIAEKVIERMMEKIVSPNTAELEPIVLDPVLMVRGSTKRYEP